MTTCAIHRASPALHKESRLTHQCLSPIRWQIKQQRQRQCSKQNRGLLLLVKCHMMADCLNRLAPDIDLMGLLCSCAGI